MDRPLIGIPTFGRNAEAHFTLPAAFVECVRRAGGIPVLLPPGEPHLDQWFETVDAILVASGGDVDPELYGGAPHPTIRAVDRERDQDEVDLIHQAIEAEMPLLAVCRGMQILNVALGGTLVPDIPAVLGDRVAHRVAHRVPTVASDSAPRDVTDSAFAPVAHEVVVDPGSRLALLLGGNRLAPSSWHHQAVATLGDGLVAVAHAPDGVVEALEMPEHPWLFAVQWHPELDAARDPMQQRLFAGLVRAAQGEDGLGAG